LRFAMSCSSVASRRVVECARMYLNKVDARIVYKLGLNLLQQSSILDSQQMRCLEKHNHDHQHNKIIHRFASSLLVNPAIRMKA
jgi:hypothetical protein